MATQASIDQVNLMYVAYYGRPGDPAGVNFWADVLDVNGGELTAGIIAAFGDSAEFTTRFGSLTNEELIDNLYQQMFNRDADDAGMAFYLAQLTAGTSTLGDIALDIANGAQGEDLIILNNKINTAGYFTAQVTATGADYDDTDLDAATAILADVTADPISVVTQKLAVNDYLVDQGGVDSTVTLTTAVDTVKITTAGTVDVINGVVDGDSDADTSGSTFTIGDSITGNNKSILKLAVLEGGDASFATVKNVATIDLLAGVGTGVDFNAVDWTGIGQVQLNKGVDGLWAYFSNLHAGVDLSVGSAVSGSLTVDYTDGHGAWIFSDKGASISYMDGGDIAALAGAGDDVSAEVWTHDDGVDLTIGDVTFSGAAADSAWFEVEATEDVAGDVTIGNVSMTGFNEVDFYVWNSDHTALSPAANTTIGDVTLAVGTSGSISVSIYNTGSGTVGNTTIGNVSLTAGDNVTSAYFYQYQWGELGAGDVTVGDVSVVAGVSASDANVWIENYAGWNGGAAVAPIVQGDMTVGNVSYDLGMNAIGYFSASAEAYTSAAGIDLTVGTFTIGDLSANLAQDASMTMWFNQSAYAWGGGAATVGDVSIGNGNFDLAVDASFSVTVDVSAYSNGGPAATVGNVAIGDVDLAMGINSDASFEYTVYAYGTDPAQVSVGDVSIGNVNVVVDDGAHLDWSISVTSYGVLGDVAVGDMSVAVGVSGDAHMSASFSASMDIGNVTIGDVDLTVGQDGSAYMSYSLSAEDGAVGDITIGDINAAAVAGAWASFEFSVEGETAIGDVTIGDVSISALGLNASASVEFDIENDSVGTIGAVTVGDVDMTVNGDSAYGRFYISASSAASAGPVTVGDLDLAVGNAAASTGSFLEVSVGNDVGDVVVGDINLSGVSLGATLTYSADVSIWASDSISIGNIVVSGGDGAADNFRSFGSAYDWNVDADTADHGETSWLSTAAGAAGVTIAGVDYSAYGTSAWIDVSGYKGAATIEGSAFGDLITDNTGANTITGGAGADTFTFLDGNTGQTVATMDKITDFSNASGDKIDLSVAVNVGNYGEASYADFAAFVTGVNAANKDVFVGLVGGVGYAAVDYDANDTVDFMIELTGLNSLGNIDVASFA